MKLKNPTDNDIAVQFNGVKLEVEALGAVEVSESEAAFWLGIHPFLEEVEEDTKEVKKVVKKEVKEEVKEETSVADDKEK